MAVLRPEGPKRRQARAEGRSRATTLFGELSEQQYVVNGTRILSTTGYSVKMKSWDEKSQRVKPHQTNAKKQTAAQINKYLNGVEGVVLDFENTCKVRPSQEQLALYYGIGRYISFNTRKGFGGRMQSLLLAVSLVLNCLV